MSKEIETQSKYGCKWPNDWGNHQIELACWANYQDLRNPELERWEHLKNAILIMDEEMREGWNEWTDRMCRAYGKYPYIAAMGCTASSKTHTFHKLAFYDYMSDPLNSRVTCTTTNSTGLDQRMWPVISQTYRRLKGARIIDEWKIKVAPHKVIQPDATNTKNVIRAIPIDERADKEKTVDTLIGVHTSRYIWLVDEATSAPSAVMDAWLNALAGTKHKRLVMMGNPNDYADTLATFARPINGWDSIDENTEEWEFEFAGEKGICLRFDGTKSPNFTHPRNKHGDSKWPWLYDHRTLEAHLAAKETHPLQYWRFCRGHIAPEGVSKRVVTMAMIDRHKCKSDALFKGGDIKKFASLDPSFTSSGDRSMLMLWKKGLDMETKKIVMQRTHKIRVPIDPTKGMPGEQVGKICLAKCLENGVDTIGIDTTTNNSAVAEWLTNNSSLKVIWIPFGGNATDREVSENDKRLCKDLYFNFASELAFAVANHLPIIRGLDDDTCVELCTRYWEPVGDKPTRQKIEGKPEYKERMKKSPDCFVAGTMILTKDGERPIEEIKVGDKIRTPYGYSKVAYLHCTEAKEITTARFTNGRMLQGKGAHKVFTWDHGWVRLDELLFTMETESVNTLWIWNILNLLLTKVPDSAFKQRVDTISQTGKTMGNLDFYTGGFGKIILARFLLAFKSIIKTATGQTIARKIWNLSPHPNTPNYIIKSGKPIQNLLPKPARDLLMQESQQNDGTHQKRGWHGTQNMANMSCHYARISKRIASYVASIIRPNKQNQSFAQIDVCKNQPERGTKSNVIVRNAEKYSQSINTSPLYVVPIDVATCGGTEPRKTYNLTLEEDNVYYANGILVQNCADCVAIATEVFRQIGGASLKLNTMRSGDWNKRMKTLNMAYESTYA